MQVPSTFQLYYQSALQLLSNIFYFILFCPLSFFVPKKKNRIVFIGRDNGKYLDNVKYLYNYVNENNRESLDVIFITTDPSTHRSLQEAKLPVTNHPSIQSIRYLLTANIIVADSIEWIANGKFQLACFSKKVQLWHGIPLKDIELPLFYKRLASLNPLARLFIRFQKFISGRYHSLDLVIGTSDFVTGSTLSKAFNSKIFASTGYPRNDILYQKIFFDNNRQQNSLLSTDFSITRNVSIWKNSGKKIICYLPTFRKNQENPLNDNILNLYQLDNTLKTNKIILILKLHPALSDSIDTDKYSNIYTYQSSCDIYPLLGISDALITDYSSIYFDYLHLNKPIIFFTFDYTQYIKSDRSLLFHFDTHTPGPKCYSQKQLEDALSTIEDDKYGEEREELARKMFTYLDGNSSARVAKHLIEMVKNGESY